MNKHFSISWARPSYWGDEEKYVLEALRSSWISGGPFVDRLERDVETFGKFPYALATSNGTTALHLAYLGLGIGAGDEIIVPAFAFMAAANIAIHAGAKPVFADVDRRTWCMTAEAIAPRLSDRTKAIVPVHTYGSMCEMEDIIELAASRRIPIVEDAAEAFGSTYQGRMAGTLGTIGTFSFHATKTITTGEGGMVATASRELRDKMSLYRSHGVGRRRYWHEVAGHNFRLTNLQAALGCAQLGKIEAISRARREMLMRYQERLGRIAGVRVQRVPKDVDPIPWAVAVELDPAAFPQSRDQVMEEMSSAGIETRPGFYPPGVMPHFHGASANPNAQTISERVIVLPSSPSLEEHEIDSVCARLARLRR